MSSPSPIWQVLLFCVAGLWLLMETWRGWRNGVVRAGMQLAAVVLSGLAALAAGRIAAWPFGGWHELPGMIAGGIAGLGVGMVVFSILWILGALLFKRTEDQRHGFVRILWGAGGACFGFVLGVFLLWGAISIVRSVGTFAEARLDAKKEEKRPAVPIAAGLVTLKDSLELGPAGRVVETIDVIPPDFYQLMLELGTVTGSPQAMTRFLEYPAVQELLHNPRMSALVNDPEVARAAESGNPLRLLSCKALYDAAKDPAFARQLQKIDLRSALKFALDKPMPSPSPSQRDK